MLSKYLYGNMGCADDSEDSPSRRKFDRVGDDFGEGGAPQNDRFYGEGEPARETRREVKESDL